MHFIDLDGFEAEKIGLIIDLSLDIKNNPAAYRERLIGRSLYMLFQKTSTRTALSFGLGMLELGGDYFMQRFEDSNFSVGDIKLETQYLCQNVDYILARLKYNRDIQRMACASTIPVINGCCEKSHPMQILADLLTIKELFGTYDIKVLYVGVWNNVFNTLAKTLPRMGCSLTGITPIVNEPSFDDQVVAMIHAEQKVQIFSAEQATKDRLYEFACQADVIYTDTWIDMEHFNKPSYKKEKNERIGIMGDFMITRELIRTTEAVVFHDMPIHCGYEIERAVVDTHIETILQQAENRRHTAKAVLLQPGLT